MSKHFSVFYSCLCTQYGGTAMGVATGNIMIEAVDNLFPTRAAVHAAVLVHLEEKKAAFVEGSMRLSVPVELHMENERERAWFEDRANCGIGIFTVNLSSRLPENSPPAAKRPRRH